MLFIHFNSILSHAEATGICSTILEGINPSNLFISNSAAVDTLVCIFMCTCQSSSYLKEKLIP